MSDHSPDGAGKIVEWLERARLDVHDSRALYEASPSSYDNVGFLCQQATEKVIKAFLGPMTLISRRRTTSGPCW